MRAPFHDPLIIPLEGEYLGLSTDLRIPGVMTRTSPDLINWSEPFPLLPETPPSVAHLVGTNRFWAPEMVKRGDVWRLYCCASRPGKTQSVIGLAESADPHGPFTYLGDVIASQHSPDHNHANAIDPCIIADREGRDWLIYGSFFGGIRILPLREDGFRDAYDEGKLIAGGGHKAIEGAYCYYDAARDRYVLFTSWGDLGIDYHIRVAYSADVTGPYIDSQGYDMTDPDPIHLPGDKLVGGHNFDLEDLPGVMATGHNSLMQDHRGLWVVHHARPEGDRRRPFLQVRQLLLAEDGRALAWPLTRDEHDLTPVDALPDKWRFVYLCRYNSGVVYGRPVDIATASPVHDGTHLRLTLFCKEWEGFIFRQGERIACSLLSPDGEALWGVAE
ncbi:MAG: arabinan endo-1,5-alpha-L-arabinosidase [Clostridia bacterium]|nr:arabinan endo-1,5-alpha-L-arabinosidase [Clostridia bacterium]